MATTVFAGIEIKDAIQKMSLYVDLLGSNTEQFSDAKCRKLVSLCFQNFMKHNDNDDYAKSVFEIIKKTALNEANFYLLYLMHIFLKNNKYFLKNARKQLELLFKVVWEKSWAEYSNAQKIEDLKVMARCWGCIYGDKVEQNIRKWLHQQYHIKKIELSPENESLIVEVFGEKTAVKDSFKNDRLSEFLKSGPSQQSQRKAIANGKQEQQQNSFKQSSAKKVDKKLLAAFDLSL